MACDVKGQAVFPVESFPALQAAERFLSSVTLHVKGQVGLVVESFPALRAAEGFFLGVKHHV